MTPLIVVQARTGSSRLPNKVLLPLAGKPLLQRLIERIHAARTPRRLVVATTTGHDDDPVRALCGQMGIPVFSGHPTDLLDRHYKTALHFGAEAVVKIPSDCPLIDPEVIDRVLRCYADAREPFDYLSNLHPATYPDGNDVEVMRFAVLEEAWSEAGKAFEREHTTPFLWERPERYRIGNVEWETGLNFSMTHRWTIDYPEDYEFISVVYDALWREERPTFGLAEILSLLERRPELSRINRRYAGVNWYRHHANELKTITSKEFRDIA
jgi:spore coat polysaccharide biosynthesis protein SpsF